MNVPVRLLVATDAALLAGLHKAGFDEPWDEQAFAALIATPGVFGILAGITEPLGFILCRAAADEAEVLTLFVPEPNRRHGVATVLLDAAIAAGTAAGAVTLFLEVAENNSAARGFYAARGFTPVGRRPRYYKGTTDAQILRRDIGSA